MKTDQEGRGGAEEAKAIAMADFLISPRSRAEDGDDGDGLANDKALDVHHQLCEWIRARCRDEEQKPAAHSPLFYHHPFCNFSRSKPIGGTLDASGKPEHCNCTGWIDAGLKAIADSNARLGEKPAAPSGIDSQTFKAAWMMAMIAVQQKEAGHWDYINPAYQHAWEAWQAAIAAGEGGGE